MRVKKFEFIKRWIDLDHVLSITNAELDTSRSGPPVVKFSIQFAFVNEPTVFGFDIPLGEYDWDRLHGRVFQCLSADGAQRRIPENELDETWRPLQLIRVQTEIDKLTQEWDWKLS